MPIPKTPQWRTEPEQVWINCQAIKEFGQHEEFIVQFETNGESYVSFVPKRFVDLSSSGMQAVIIADVDGGVLVDIPAETLTSGPRILVLDTEKDSVLRSAGWISHNGA